MSAPRQIRSVLIANRGEIAARVIRAVQELGLRAIAVYSDADRDAVHVRLADDAVHIGPAPATESYLSIQRLLTAARETGADAVHPGYGFLSENPLFVEACVEAGLIFIGPPASAMRLLGDKVQAKRVMLAAGVPVLPGYHEDDQSDDVLTGAAEEIGFPILIKAAAGGGGRGMRRVDAGSEMTEALASARREAQAAFGDNRVLLERLLEGARHIEVQVLCDAHGSIRHLGERECSVQRRHQKVIEEAPSPVVDEILRAALGDTAVRVMREAGYVGAGTVEFLLGQDGRFYFMEVNARLQVEHPVTELAWGIDLVKEQIHIAQGETLRELPEAPRLHAIECRICAEDARRNYQPSTGLLARFNPPLGPQIRHDSGVESGSVVSPYYDSLLAKMITWGETRAEALQAARWALSHYEIAGVTTNLPQLQFVLNDPEFSQHGVTIDFLERAWTFEDEPPIVPATAFVFAAAYALLSSDETGTWRLGGQGVNHTYRSGSQIATIVSHQIGTAWRIACDTNEYTWEPPLPLGEGWGEGERSPQPPSSEITLEQNGQRTIATVTESPDHLIITIENDTYEIHRLPPPSAEATGDSPQRAGSSRIEAPMPGRITRILASPGMQVKERQPLVIMEAMKIEHTVSAPRDGVIKQVLSELGDQVDRGAILVEMEEA